MEETMQTVETTEVAKPRYSVSRKGAGGRKPKYTPEQLTEILNLVKTGHKSLGKVCKEKNHPYVSIRAALIRNGVWPVTVASA